MAIVAGLIGFFLGCLAATVIMSLMFVASEADDEIEQLERCRECKELLKEAYREDREEV